MKNRKSPGPITLSPLTLALILIVVALALIVGWVMLHQRPAVPLALPATTWPNRALTPGAVDPAPTDADICAHDWAPGDPPQQGGDLTYSKAARHTSIHVKDAVYAEYHIVNPHDGGHSWEIDHLVPLALGGRDVKENLWPESRSGEGLNAWAKDRLEYRLYRLVCDPPAGTQHLPLGLAQAAFRTDWVVSYHKYCADDADCPAFRGD